MRLNLHQRRAITRATGIMAAFFFFLCSASLVSAQTRQPTAAPETNSDYRLGAGDLLEVSVFGVENFRFTRRISSSGFITLPYVGKISVSGLTTTQLEEELTTSLDGRLIQNPQVSVFVMEFHAQPAVILGAVANPGLYEMSRPLKLLDIIALAGGLSERAGDQISVYRQGIGAPKKDSGVPENGENGHNGGESAVESAQKPQVQSVSLKALFHEGVLSENVPIERGDVIYIPEVQPSRFYVIGEVTTPGAYALPGEQGLLVSQALSLAGGPIKTAKMSKGMLVRYHAGGAREEIQVNFSDILKGKKPDFLVHADDIIFIPGSTVKSVGYGLLGIIPTVATQTAVVRGSR